MTYKSVDIESFSEIQTALEIGKFSDELNEEDMIIQIERRIAELMEREMDLLLSYLYRLDIAENKINECLNPGTKDHPYTCLAKLIWNRQKERIETKRKYSRNEEVEEGWEW